MLPEHLSSEQQALVEAPLREGQRIFLTGPAGAGKSTVLAARIAHLLEQGVPAYTILVLLPDRPAREQLRRSLREVPLGPYGTLSLHTYYSLAQRMVALFWPLVARPAGFAHPERPPLFLSYELAQYHIGQIVEPLLEEDYFEGLHLHPQRLLSQLLDNLNKAALNGYPLREVGLRLSSAWKGPPERPIAFQQAQECIERFRQDCLARGVLDLSLVLEVFSQHLLETPPFWGYFSERYRHLLVDNLEENVPVAHDFVARLLPHCDSALLAYDQGGGYRILLGAEPEEAWSLQLRCSTLVRLDAAPTPADPLAEAVAARLGQGEAPIAGVGGILGLIERRYRSDMIAGVADELAATIEQEGVPAEEIVVLAPYLDGVLRFSLSQACARLGVPLQVVRRYRRPVEEPAVRALLTLAAIVHPEWNLPPHRYDVAEALGQVLEGIDPVRAALLADWAYDPTGPALRTPEGLAARSEGRLGPTLLARYRAFWERWEAVPPAADLPWEHFLAHLLGHVLPGAVEDPATATACAELLESARRFRQIFPVLHEEDTAPIGRSYLEMLHQGLVTAQYLVDQEEPAGAVLLAPAHSYLLTGRPVRRQFWLDVASVDWWTPPQQPLTNPHVLSRRRPLGAPWDDAEDHAVRQATLVRVIKGLCRRCREGVVLCRSELGTTGQPQDSPLLRALEPILDRWAGEA